MSKLVQALTSAPGTILQTLSDTILEVCKSDSAGISLLTKDQDKFYWAAISGAWKIHVGGGTPRDFGPCGDVLDRDAPLLFKRLERRYGYFLPVTPAAEECLLVPFHVEGRAVGAIWVLAHDERRKFDAEDLRQLISLGRFATAAYQATEALAQRTAALEQSARRVVDLQQITLRAQDSRSSAVHLMNDAVRARQAIERLNVELGASEERYRNLFESAPMAVFVCDKNGVIQHYNWRAVEVWGREPERGIERYCGSVSLWRPDGTLLPHDLAPVAEVLRTGVPALNVEVVVERPDGSLLPVLVNCAAHKSGQGEVTGAVGSFTDITERKQLEDELSLRNGELAAADGAKDHFLAVVSHELRSPLGIMRLWSQILQRPGRSEDDLRTGLDVIDRSSRAQAQLVEDLLDVHRISTGKLRLELDEVDLNEIIRLVIESMSPAAAEKGILLDRKIDPIPAHTSGDPARLQQVFGNLLGNAIKFTPMGGEIQIALRRRGLRVEISVKDTGDGISAARLPHIFERLRQADPLATHAQAGLGLGLVIAKQLVELHGGSITAASPGRNSGATFTVSLPVLAEIKKAWRPTLPVVRTTEAQSPSLNDVLVLVVEDEVDAREAVRRILEDAGAKTTVVGCVEEALDALGQELPDVILSDIGMPGLDGYDLIRSIRALPPRRGGRVPAVALTVYAASEDRDRALSTGFQTHLAKPVEPSQLVAALSALASQTPPASGERRRRKKSRS